MRTKVSTREQTTTARMDGGCLSSVCVRVTVSRSHLTVAFATSLILFTLRAELLSTTDVCNGNGNGGICTFVRMAVEDGRTDETLERAVLAVDESRETV